MRQKLPSDSTLSVAFDSTAASAMETKIRDRTFFSFFHSSDMWDLTSDGVRSFLEVSWTVDTRKFFKKLRNLMKHSDSLTPDSTAQERLAKKQHRLIVQKTGYVWDHIGTIAAADTMRTSSERRKSRTRTGAKKVHTFIRILLRFCDENLAVVGCWHSHRHSSAVK